MPESFTDGDERELRSHLSKLGAIAKEFGSTRNTIAEEHPEWVEVKDARHELFARCSTVFNCTILGFLSHLNYLSHPDVWRHQKPKPTTGQIVKSLTSFDSHLRFGLVHGLFSVIESSFRVLAQTLDPDVYRKNARNFKSTYSWFLKTLNLVDHEPLLDLLRHIRNTVHNNGVYYHPNEKDLAVKWKGHTYTFVIGERPDFVGWQHLLSMLPDLSATLTAVVKGDQIVALKAVPETIGKTRQS